MPQRVFYGRILRILPIWKDIGRKGKYIYAKSALQRSARRAPRYGAEYVRTVFQDLSEDPRQTLKHSQNAPGNFPSHHVNVKQDSRIFNLVGSRPYVNSRHHQALNQIGNDLRVTARADDQIPEAIESIDNDRVLAVQWHPENMFKHYDYSQALFADLIQRAQE